MYVTALYTNYTYNTLTDDGTLHHLFHQTTDFFLPFPFPSTDGLG